MTTIMTGAKIQGIAPNYQTITASIICPSKADRKAYLPAKISIKDILLFLVDKPVVFIRIPFDSDITTFVFGHREQGSIEAIVLRKQGKSTIVFTDHQEIELVSLNQLVHYKPFLHRICLS